MTGIAPYLLFPGNAGEALEFYRSAFGGALEIRTFGDFWRVDAPDDAVAHGALVGPVATYEADAGARARRAVDQVSGGPNRRESTA